MKLSSDSEALQHWIDRHPEDLQLRPGQYLALAVPHGLVAAGKTWTDLLVAVERALTNGLPADLRAQPCFIIQSRGAPNRGQA